MLQMLNRYETDIANVESVQSFVDMKWLQNEISRISTNLIQNLKIKIISILVFNWYFFEICQLCIESYLIDIELILNHILSVSCINFSISPTLANNY
jgi:hypothetical protein